MRKALLLLVLTATTLTGFGQHGGIYGEWFLTYYELNGNGTGVMSIDPPISPNLTIENDLQISGFAACNSFSGNFIYDNVNDQLIIESIEVTTNECEFQSHTDFENDYFAIYTIGASFQAGIIYHTNGTECLFLILPNGDQLFYDPHPIVLTTDGLEFPKSKIYPNPTSDVLNISSEAIIETLTVYSVSGQHLISISENTNSLDVSTLSEGIYFLEILTETGRQVQKFIKN